MTTISVLTIEGTIEPAVPFVNCGLESRIPQSPGQIYLQKCDFDVDQTQYIKENFDELFEPTDPSFWKERVIIQMLSSPIIVSLSFIPYSGATCQVLFLQKTNLLSEITGFMAPYFSAEDQERIGAMSRLPSCRSVQSDEQSINDALNGLGQCSIQLKPILSYFVQDTKTCFLGITYLDNGKLISHSWCKA